MPNGATYAYVILPGKSEAETASYAGSPAVRILENNGDVQSVIHAGLGIRAVNFWTGAKSAAGIGSDGVASVLVHQANACWTLRRPILRRQTPEATHRSRRAVGALVFQDAGSAWSRRLLCCVWRSP